MKRFKILFVPIIVLFQVSILCAQTSHAETETNSFISILDRIEANTKYQFFFNPEEINEIDISGINEKNFQTELNPLLRTYGFSAYFSQNNVFIYKGAPIVTHLPVYEMQLAVETKKIKKDTITQVERNYIEGTIVASTDVLVIGDKNKQIPGKKCIVNGRISDKTTGEPLVGATVYIPEIEAGALTDIDGRFKMVLITNKYKVRINHMSMEKKELIFQVYSSGPVHIEMDKELIKINEVVVSSSRNDNVKGMQMGFEKISAKSMKEIPLVMGEKDVLKVAQMLPGVENMGEGASGFNVRGSSADQNMFYLNKIPVYNTSHLLGFFSAFSPDIVQDFTLYKSNIPARYGGRLASVFDISTRQGNKREFYGQGGISPVTAHFAVEGPTIKDHTSVVASWRSSYSDWILKRINTMELNKSHAFFYDASLGLNSEINEKNLLKVFLYRSEDDFALSDKNNYNYKNTGTSVSWKHLFSTSLTGDFAAVFSNYSFKNNDTQNPSDAYEQNYGISQYDIKADFNLVSTSNHRLEFGAVSSFYNINRGKIRSYGEESDHKPIDLGIDNGIETAIYLSDEYQLLPRLSILGGIRYSSFIELGGKEVNTYRGKTYVEDDLYKTTYYNKGEIVKFYSSPEYRGAINWGITNSTALKASYNRTRQYIFMLSNTMAISPNDQWKLVGSNITPPIADQVSLGVYQNITKKAIEISVEAYYKKINDIVEYRDGADFLSPAPIEWTILQGKQFTQGMEFMVRKKSGKLTGWMSYTNARSIIQVSSDFPNNEINGGEAYPSNYDRPHSFNFVSNYKVNRRLSLSTNFVYTTGRPVTLMTEKYILEGQDMPGFSKRNEYRIPNYIRWDLSINLEGNLKNKKLGHSFWMVNVYNVLGRKNVYSIFPVVEEEKIKYKQLSIFAQPIITISWNFKFGNYLSE